MAKLKAPPNFGGMSIEGRAVKPALDGTVTTVDPKELAALKSHGFVDVDLPSLEVLSAKEQELVEREKLAADKEAVNAAREKELNDRDAAASKPRNSK